MTVQVEVHLSKNGEETLKINDYFIHSKYNPKREAVQLAEKHYTPHHAHILFGYGKGHLINALLEVRKFNEIIIVVDPLFNDNYIERPISNEKENIYFLKTDILNDFEQYIGFLAKEIRTMYKVICLTNYEKIFIKDYKLLLEKIKDVQNRNVVNDITLLRYSSIWYENFLENIFHLQNDFSAKVLEKAYTVPAIIVSGGPSLLKQIELIKHYRRRFIIICAGSTINSLIAEDIEPDYVVTIDGGEPNYHHFKELKLKHAKIVYTMQNHPRVRDSFEKRGYVVESKGNPMLTRYVKEELNVELPMFIGGASVAHTAFNFANYITTGPIALIGQDLAYTDDLTHALTNKNARKIDEQFINQNEAFQIEGYTGDSIWTNPVLNSMRLEFEDLIKINPPQKEFFNCTEGGAKIKGYTQMSFREFCKKYASQKEVKILEHNEPKNDYSSIECLIKERKQYAKLTEILNEAIIILKANYSKKQFDSSSLKKLDKIDRQIQKLVGKLTIDTIISPVTMRIMRSYLPKVNETPLEAFERSNDQMQDLYQSLKSKVAEATTIINKIIEKRKSHE